jgi:hypothetical protein
MDYYPQPGKLKAQLAYFSQVQLVAPPPRDIFSLRHWLFR